MSHQPAGGNGPATPASGTPSEEPKHGLSVVKVTGQALAAVTTAGVGAFFGGAEGTVAGAALASVVTTVGDVIYQRSLERTRDTVRAAIRGRRDPSGRSAPGVDAGPGRPVPAPYGAGEGTPGRRGDGGPTRQMAGGAAPGRGGADVGAPGRPVIGDGGPTRQMAGDGVPGRHGADPAAGGRHAPPPWPPPAASPPPPAGSPGRHWAPPDAEPTSTLSGPPVTVRQAPRGPNGAPAGYAAARNGHGAPPPPDESPTRSIPPVDPDATRVQGGPGDPGATRVQGGPPPTRVAPAMGDDARTELVGSGPGGPDDPDEPGDGEPPRRGWGAKRYALLAATAALIFLVAMLGVTGIERIKGSSLSGGVPGSTSVGSVFRGGAPTTKTPTPSGESTPTTSAPTSANPSSEAPTTTTRSRSGGANGDSGGNQETTTERSRPGGLLPTGLLGN